MTEPRVLMEYQFPADPALLCQVREKLRDTLSCCDLSDTLLNCVLLAIGEATMNIIEHAYGGAEQGDIILEVERQQNNLIFRLTDFAHRKSSMDEMKSRPLNEIRPGGLGCHIINEIMDEVKLIECPETEGNILQMKKCLDDESCQELERKVGCDSQSANDSSHNNQDSD